MSDQRWCVGQLFYVKLFEPDHTKKWEDINLTRYGDEDMFSVSAGELIIGTRETALPFEKLIGDISNRLSLPVGYDWNYHLDESELDIISSQLALEKKARKRNRRRRDWPIGTVLYSNDVRTVTRGRTIPVNHITESMIPPTYCTARYIDVIAVQYDGRDKFALNVGGVIGAMRYMSEPFDVFLPLVEVRLKVVFGESCIFQQSDAQILNLRNHLKQTIENDISSRRTLDILMGDLRKLDAKREKLLVKIRKVRLHDGESSSDDK